MRRPAPCPRRSGCTRSLALAGMLCALVLGGCAQTRQRLHTGPWSGSVRLEAEQVDESRGSGPTQVDQKETALREELALRISGDYYHPKLVEFDVRGELDLDQRDIDSSGAEERTVDAVNLSYDLRTRWFKDLPYSGELYSFRNNTRARQTFFSTTEAVVSETGAAMNARDWWMPSRLSLSSYDYRSDGQGDFEESRDSLSLKGGRVEEDARYQYSVEVDDVELGQQQRSFRSQNATASTSHRFGEHDDNRWTNSVRFRRQTGDVSTETVGTSSAFHTRLSENLVSDSDLQYSSSSTEGVDSDALNLTTGVTHQLFQSLTSSLNGRWGQTGFEGGDVDTVGSVGQLIYRKVTPLGILNLRYLLDFYIQDQQSDGGLASVVDEAHVYTPGVPLLLDSTNVVEASVVVTDGTGLTLYLLGVHYLVVAQGVQTRIDVIPGAIGGIVPGQTILVDYSFVPIPGLKFDSLTQNTSAMLNIEDLADISVAHARVDQTLRSGSDEGTLEDSQRTTAGLRVYRFGAVFGADYESLDSDHTPFSRLNYLASYQVPVGDTLSWRLAGSTFHTTFPDASEDERGTTLSTNLFASLGRELTGALRGEWHKIQFRTDEGSGLLVEANLTRQFRSSQVALILRFVDEEFDVATDLQRTTIRLSFTRRF